MVCPVYFLVFLVSSTYAANTYNLPLLQETLEIIGGDIFNSVTNMLNGGDFNDEAEARDAEKKPLYEQAEDQPNGIDDSDLKSESVIKSAIDLPGKEKLPEVPKVSEVTSTITAPATEVPDDVTETEDEDQEDDDNDTVDDDDSAEEEKASDETKAEDGNLAETNKVKSTAQNQEAEETKPKMGEEASGNQDETGDNNGEDEENDDDDDEAKILASAVVNIAAQKIKHKLVDLELMN